MTADGETRTEYFLVDDKWNVREFENEAESLEALKTNEHAVFIYRTFLERVSAGWNSTGKIEFCQRESDGWTDILSSNGWKVVGLDSRGFRFKIKDPKNEIKWIEIAQRESDELYGVKWPKKSSYTGWIAKILSELSKFDDWDACTLKP